MKLETYTITTIIGILCSVGFGMIISAVINWRTNRKRNQAETNFLTVQAYNVIAQELHKQIEDLRIEVRNLRDNEKEYKRIIAGYDQREKHHIKRISELEDQLTIIIKSQTQTTS